MGHLGSEDQREKGKDSDLNTAIDWKSMEAAIGIQNFSEVRDKGAYYVDKSELIGRILEKRSTKAFLFTRPRRFGKSLNLSMLDAYLNLKYKGNSWFDGLKVSELRPDDPMKNSFPVICVDMKGMYGYDYSMTVDCVSSQMAKVFWRHNELRDSEALSPEQRDVFRRLAGGKGSEGELESSLQTLSMLLEIHYGRKAVILIDEYDTPINSTCSLDDSKRILGFFRRFLSDALKGNDSLEFSVMTGIMQISKESIFSGLNNLRADSILSAGFDDMFGFTEPEVRKLCADFGRPERFAEAKEWYDGYRFGNADLYNPWSILMYVSEKFTPGKYWAGTSGNSIIADLVNNVDHDMFGDLKILESGGSISADIEMSVTFEGLRDPGGKDIYSVLAASGYLRAEMDGGHYRLTIPNREMQKVYCDAVIGALGRFRDVRKPVDGFCSAVLKGDVKAMEESLQNVLDALASIRILDSEHVYQMMVLMMLARLRGTCEVDSDHEAGDGYYDIRVLSLVPRSPSIIIEIKRCRTAKQAETAAKAAITQIRDRRYFSGLKGEAILYGVAFFGKKTKIAVERISCGR